MPVYNASRYVAEAIESILNQTLSDFEFIIIDDCSTDDTCDIINTYTDRRIILICKQVNTGIISSLNLGITKGQFIARMDGDDISDVNRLGKQVDFMHLNPEITVCGTWFRLIPSNQIIDYPGSNEAIKIAFLDFCAIGHPTAMIRTDFIRAKKLEYDPSFKSAEDYDLWTRIASAGKFANIPEPLLSYRLHAGQVSITDHDNQVKHSHLCRLRMINYLLGTSGEKDVELSNLSFYNDNIVNIDSLLEVINWLNKLLALNESKNFYNLNLFAEYIENKKKNITGHFYLKRAMNNPRTLYYFIKMHKYLKDSYNFSERLKFGVKCLAWWN